MNTRPHGDRRPARGGILRAALCACLAAAVALAAPAASAAVVHVKRSDGQRATLGGWIIDETNDYIVLQLPSKEERKVLRSTIERIEQACDTTLLEALSPDAPGGYLSLGKTLMMKQGDPEALATARHLFCLAAKLDPPRLYTEATRRLAQASTGAPRAEYLRWIVLLDPFDRVAMAEYHRAKVESEAQVQTDLRNVIKVLQLFRAGNADEGAKLLLTIKAPDVRLLAEGCTPKAGAQVGCTFCDNTGFRACAKCRGDGTVVCPVCKGLGARRSASHYNIACTTCRGVGAVACNDCGGTGRVRCDKCPPPSDPGFESRVDERIARARAMLQPDRYWWLAPADTRVPRFGVYTFDKGVNYENTVFRAGIWTRP